ncbi:secretin N-terminal domain-containing protein [Uliginosibacterium sp. TH139]|uniref:secretin N-terminal domain-containing protein n=1 Tax=Uliginosibacterium sp. TH139 TaxID=2067453 RepID=UPI000C7A4563|nr:secretin N-terminal domain-containing protein [Uliginosibacterium sp. TH139]PLK49635.1 hypothetical protein C0V76_04180 [Uliginosibacterium sp. TH139]
MLRLILALLCCAFALPLAAQQQMEIIALRHRLPEQVLPTLQPLLEPGGSLSAMSGKLIVRTTPANLAQLRRALEAIDTPVRRLLISVRQGGSQSREETYVGADGRVVIRNGEVGGAVRAGAEAGSRERRENIVSQVQTVEDGEAFIQLGQSVPQPVTQVVQGPGGTTVTRTTQYVSAGSGFAARPRLAGDNVTVSIAPQSQRIAGNGRVSGSGLTTTVSGKLGQWIPLGGISQQSETSGHGLTSYERGRSETSSEYWIRVESLD